MDLSNPIRSLSGIIITKTDHHSEDHHLQKGGEDERDHVEQKPGGAGIINGLINDADHYHGAPLPPLPMLRGGGTAPPGLRRGKSLPSRFFLDDAAGGPIRRRPASTGKNHHVKLYPGMPSSSMSHTRPPQFSPLQNTRPMTSHDGSLSVSKSLEDNLFGGGGTSLATTLGAGNTSILSAEQLSLVETVPPSPNTVTAGVGLGAGGADPPPPALPGPPRPPVPEQISTGSRLGGDHPRPVNSMLRSASVPAPGTWGGLYHPSVEDEHAHSVRKQEMARARLRSLEARLRMNLSAIFGDMRLHEEACEELVQALSAADDTLSFVESDADSQPPSDETCRLYHDAVSQKTLSLDALAQEAPFVVGDAQRRVWVSKLITRLCAVLASQFLPGDSPLLRHVRKRWHRMRGPSDDGPDPEVLGSALQAGGGGSPPSGAGSVRRFSNTVEIIVVSMSFTA